jgi:hypothetical protein
VYQQAQAALIADIEALWVKQDVSEVEFDQLVRLEAGACQTYTCYLPPNWGLTGRKALNRSQNSVVRCV